VFRDDKRRLIGLFRSMVQVFELVDPSTIFRDRIASSESKGRPLFAMAAFDDFDAPWRLAFDSMIKRQVRPVAN
jgi:hypothetical protein